MNDYYRSIQRFVFERDADNGCLIGPDGAHYDTEAEALCYGQAGLCGCGCPEDVYRFLLDCMAARRDDAERIIDYKKVEALVRERPEVVTELVLHFLDSKQITEHGGSVYGSWLTPRGEQMLEVGPMKERA